MSDYDELKSLRERVERTEDNVCRRGIFYKLLLLIAFIGTTLGIIYLLGYWPEFMGYVCIAIEKLIDVYLQLRDAMSPLLAQLKA